MENYPSQNRKQNQHTDFSPNLTNDLVLVQLRLQLPQIDRRRRRRRCRL